MIVRVEVNGLGGCGQHVKDKVYLFFTSHSMNSGSGEGTGQLYGTLSGLDSPLLAHISIQGFHVLIEFDD